MAGLSSAEKSILEPRAGTRGQIAEQRDKRHARLLEGKLVGVVSETKGEKNSEDGNSQACRRH